ncbi:hypothetical protein [Flavobacterium sp.]|uniref:hypothetical protein n=1 Tax=Flavobacterium sp. TaxID=239 RepID=UPI002488472E|nr:hypothetical protein [Flavobacterium sp.]MDI1318098.1 hypothetical protein [Flavobacterium sp.]
MKTKHPFYKISISYFNLNESTEDKRHTEKVIIFKEDIPIESRKKAIDHFRSLEDVFIQAKKNGNVLTTITEILDKPVTAEIIPSLNLYICENDNSDDDLVLFGSLLETLEERLIELADESLLYHENNIDNEGFDLITDSEGTVYTILKNSLFKDEDNNIINK